MDAFIMCVCPHCDGEFQYSRSAWFNEMPCPLCGKVVRLVGLTTEGSKFSQNARDLLQFCDSISSDGELTGDELYQLAEWLNNRKEACHEWPGSELVGPLQGVWADGKITKTELKTIARLLRCIQKERIKREAAQVSARQAKELDAVLENYDVETARLPKVPLARSVGSLSEAGKSYQVELSGPSCTCADWVMRRSHLPIGHFSRCCKHILEVFEANEPTAGWPEALQCLFSLRYPPTTVEWVVLDGGSVLAALNADRTAELHLLHTDDVGCAETFLFNLNSGKWDLDRPPNGSRLAKELLGKAALL